VEPVGITQGEDGRWTVLVYQVVRSPDGGCLTTTTCTTSITFRDELVERMDIETAPSAQSQPI
jgi:hypothetical protein